MLLSAQKHIAVSCLGAGFSALAGRVRRQKSLDMKRREFIHSQYTSMQYIIKWVYTRVLGIRSFVRPDLTAGRTSSEKKY